MTPSQRPQLPLPAPLRGDEYDSFAYHSIVERLPRIGRRVLDTNNFSPAVVARVEQLLAEIPDGPIRLLQDAVAPDTEAWVAYTAPYLDSDWLEVPWFFAELYFYRRLLEATGYFVAGAGNHVDPFAPQKMESLKSSWPRVQALAAQQAERRQREWEAGSLAALLSLSLWGNQGDLSMWPGGTEAQPEGSAAAQDHYLLADERARVGDALVAPDGRPVRVDFLMDNAAFELVSDLALVDYLLDGGRADTVTLHLKAAPVFVSDALIQDVRQTIDLLAAAGEAAVAAFGRRLQHFLGAGRLHLARHRFWNSPLPAWEMPDDLRRSLAPATLIVAKGDANYRRLLGDRHWAFSAPFAQIVSYLPAPLVALRTLKSDLAAGIPPARIAELVAAGEAWTTSGRYGVIQFAPGPAARREAGMATKDMQGVSDGD